MTNSRKRRRVAARRETSHCSSYGLFSDVKTSLATKLLDGALVTYTGRKQGGAIRGIINNGRFQCGCSYCNYDHLFSARAFEMHIADPLGSTSDYIFLENGKSLNEVVKHLASFLFEASHKLEEITRCSIDSNLFIAWREGLPCMMQAKIIEEIIQDFPPDLLSHLRSCITPKWRRSRENRGQIPEPPLDCHNQLRSEMSYPGLHQEGRRDPSTKINMESIYSCPASDVVCTTANAVRQSSDLNRKYPVIESQLEANERPVISCQGTTSFHQSALEVSERNMSTKLQNEHWCRICGGEEGLLACASCTRSFHSSCLRALSVSIPHGKWRCSECERSQMESVSSISASINANTRLRRVMMDGGNSTLCVLCKVNNFSLGELDAESIILCYQCEKEYHLGCLKCYNICNLESYHGEMWFCSADCLCMRVNLMKFASQGPMLIPQQLLTKLKKKFEMKGSAAKTEDILQWEILNGRCMKYRLLSEAIGMIKDAFYSITESQHDLIPAMVYGKKISWQDFGGVYSIILKVRSVIVSVGILRIFGEDVAELPLVVTLEKERGKGYLRVLLSMIEGLLCFLNVKSLVLPADDSTLPMWINKFAFVKMTGEKVGKYINEVPILLFENSTLLEKDVSDVCWASQKYFAAFQ